jgi:hypothetical protein
MIETLIQIIILCVVLGLVYYLIMLLPIPDPFRKIVQIVFIIIAILVVLSLFGLGGSVNLGHWKR